MRGSRLQGAVSIGVVLVFSVVLLAMLAAKARAKPFWHDEVYTILVSELPSVGTMWAAARDGIDLAPPLNALATRVAHQVSGAGPVASRVPPIVGYWLVSVMFFEFVRKRSTVVHGVTAALLPTLTAAFRLSYEARSYGLMLALFTAAIFFWAEAAAGRRRGLSLTIMAAAIGLGLWNQYWAVLVFVPLAIGELARLVRSRQPDWTMWATMAAAGATAFPLVPLMQVASSQSATFWRHASIADIRETYAFLFEPLFAQRFGVAVAGAALLVVAGKAVRGRREEHQQENHQEHRKMGVPVHEAAAIAACALVPVFAVLVGVAITGVFVPRYALPGIIGVSLGVPLLVAWSGSLAGLAAYVLAGVFVWTFAESAQQTFRAPPAFRDPVAGRRLLLDQLSSGGPVVVTGSVAYLQLWYYTPLSLRTRLQYLADPPAAVRYTGSDTIDVGYQALHRWTTVGVADYDRFVAEHPQFVAYALGSGWLLDKLRDDHASLQEIGREAGATVYAVRIAR